MKVQTTLRNIVRHLLESLTKNIVYSIDFSGVTIKRKGGIGFLRTSNFNIVEKDFLASLNLKGKTIYDIGGHIGVFSIFFSKMSGANGNVFTFEPNSENIKKINDNIMLNNIDNVKIIDYGISDKRENVELFVRKGASATGSMNINIQSTIADEKYYEILEVKVDALDNLIVNNHLPLPEFIKVDIEGMEYFGLLGMQDTIMKKYPELYIEIHGSNSDDKLSMIRQVSTLLFDMSYKIYHVESGENINKDNYSIAKEGHIYCTHK